jgi:hypothetical protein
MRAKSQQHAYSGLGAQLIEKFLNVRRVALEPLLNTLDEFNHLAPFEGLLSKDSVSHGLNMRPFRDHERGGFSP